MLEFFQFQVEYGGGCSWVGFAGRFGARIAKTRLGARPGLSGTDAAPAHAAACQAECTRGETDGPFGQLNTETLVFLVASFYNPLPKIAQDCTVTTDDQKKTSRHNVIGIKLGLVQNIVPKEGSKANPPKETNMNPQLNPDGFWGCMLVIVY